MSTIVIDPGHGKGLRPKYDDGTCETDVAWNTAERLRDLLAAEHRVFLTKDSRDASPSPSERGRIAVRHEADIFVSLHCNATEPHPNRRGVFGIFYGKAPIENRAPDAEIHAPNGRRLARLIAQEVSDLTGIPLTGADGAKLWWKCPQNLGVLTGGGNWKKTKAACLIEAGFLTNDADRTIMGSDRGQQQYAVGCARGIYRYLGLPFPAALHVNSDIDQGDDLEPGEEPDDDSAALLAEAVAWAETQGLTDLIDLDKPVTAEEMLMTLYRVLKP